MNITEKMKKWIIENCDVKAEAEDSEFTKAIGTALATEALSVDKYAELSAPEKAKEANEFGSKMDKIADSLASLTETLSKQADPKEKEVEKKVETVETKETQAVETPKVSEIGLAKKVSEISDKEGDGVRVKGAHEQYSTDKSVATYPSSTKSGKPHLLAGQAVKDFGRTLFSSSERDMALSGVWAKFQLLSVTPRLAGSPQRAWDILSDHEKSLLDYLAKEELWDDSEDEKLRTRKGYAPGGIKQLIDDAASGGLEAAPIVFDDQVIQTPLLHGELYPLVNTVVLDRGRRIEGLSTATVTGTWGGVDDTAIALFNTAGYVSAFDTTIFRWEGAIRIGLDFLSDTPIDFGQHITTQYGERLLQDLDDVIAAGNGTTQPEGVINATGTTTIAFGGATTLGNYELLRFGVAKPEHKSNLVNSAVFCGNETSYQRAKAIPIAAADARRIFAGVSTTSGTFDDYAIMGRAYKINESLTNAQIFYAILARYRMYRRRGLTVRTSTEGDTLMRRNEMLITVTSRYGGQIERGAIAAVTTTAEA